MNILAIFAHPDDETMLCGGTLALLAQPGFEVHYLCATRGEGGEAGEPPLCERTDLGTVRAAELACAVQVLGGASLSFLDYVDPLVGEHNKLYPYAADMSKLIAEIGEHILRLKPEVIITHGRNGEYGHPAHLQTHRAVLRAVRNYGKPSPWLYTVQAAYPGHPKPHLVNQDDAAHLILDISAAHSQKVQAALCHRTQHALFVRRASKEAGRDLSVPDVILCEESLHCRQLKRGRTAARADRKGNKGSSGQGIGAAGRVAPLELAEIPCRDMSDANASRLESEGIPAVPLIAQRAFHHEVFYEVLHSYAVEKGGE